MFSRAIFAGRVSLLVGFAVVVVSSLIGVTLGLVAGFFRRLDTPVARLIDAMMAFPEILLAIALVAALGAVAGQRHPGARRSSMRRASPGSSAPRRWSSASCPMSRRRGRSACSTPRILVSHVLRNLISPVLVQGTFIFASAMLAEAALSFLGVGVNPEIPTWGNMINAGRDYVGTADWLMVFPGVAIVLAVLSLQMVGDGLRDLLDPRLRKDL